MHPAYNIAKINAATTTWFTNNGNDSKVLYWIPQTIDTIGTRNKITNQVMKFQQENIHNFQIKVTEIHFPRKKSKGKKTKLHMRLSIHILPQKSSKIRP